MGRHTLVLLHQLSNPVVPDLLHLLAFGVQVRQGDLVVAQPALLRLRRVVVVIDRAVLVEVVLLVERVEDAVIDGVTRAVVSLFLLSFAWRASSLLLGRHTMWLATTSTMRYMPRLWRASDNASRSSSVP